MKKKVKNGNRYCPKCGHKLQKYGLTKDGGQKNGVKSQKSVNPETSENLIYTCKIKISSS